MKIDTGSFIAGVGFGFCVMALVVGEYALAGVLIVVALINLLILENDNDRTA